MQRARMDFVPSLSGEDGVQSLVFSSCCVGSSLPCVGAGMLGPDGSEIALSQLVQPQTPDLLQLTRRSSSLNKCPK